MSVTSTSSSAATSHTTSRDPSMSVTSTLSSAATSQSTSRGPIAPVSSVFSSATTSQSTSRDNLSSTITTSLTSQVNSNANLSSLTHPDLISGISLTTVLSTGNVTELSSTTISPKVCPSGSKQFENSCYLINRREMSFRYAKAFCKSLSAYLVHVDTPQENEYLKQIMRDFQDPVQYWIGIMDVITEAVWVFYNTGKNVTYFDWVPGEPDGTHEFDGAKEADCAVFDPFEDFKWRDEQCSPYHYSQTICEL